MQTDIKTNRPTDTQTDTLIEKPKHRPTKMRTKMLKATNIKKISAKMKINVFLCKNFNYNQYKITNNKFFHDQMK